MTGYRFLQFYSDLVPGDRSLPSLVSITAESREQAIQEFTRQFGLSVDSDDGDKVWLVRRRGGVSISHRSERDWGGVIHKVTVLCRNQRVQHYVTHRTSAQAVAAGT